MARTKRSYYSMGKSPFPREPRTGKSTGVPKVKKLPTLEEDVTPRPPKTLFDIPLVGDWRGAARRGKRETAIIPITHDYPMERGGLEEGVGDMLPLVLAGLAILAFTIILPKYMPRTA